ncbi:MAG: ribonuclease H-like domain-containing protein [Syntrophaceae bacterium]
MSTIKRLQRLTGENLSKNKSSLRSDEISDLRKRIESVMSRRQSAVSTSPPRQYGTPLVLEEIIEGDEIHTPHGKFFISYGFYTGSSKHGRRRIREISAIDMNAVALLAKAPNLASYNLSDALFLDTETTGLSGGTGTLAFLIGLGWFENEAFVTKQIFARDFSEERASLSFLIEFAKEKKFLVTFNGKAFDVGLLSARFVLNRLPDFLSDMPHFDLLHPSRRLLGHRLDNSRLTTLERDILGFQRDGDIPGCEIPQRYFDWLRIRDARLMVDVFEHNRLDVVSMAILTLHLTEMLNYKSEIMTEDHSDLLAVSKLLHNRGDSSGAKIILESLIDSDNSTVAFEARRTLSLIHKRSGYWNDAVRIWKMILSDDPGNFFAVVELAKLFEHRIRDIKSAIDILNNALGVSNYKTNEERESLVHRLDRLKNRRNHIQNI